MYTYDNMVKSLSEGLHIVTFTKVDGDTRVMTCTRDLTKVPAEMQPKGTMAESKQDTIRVYDVNAEGWRSFRVANVTNFE